MLEAFKRASRTCAPHKAGTPILKIVGKARKDWLKELTRSARKLKIANEIEFAEAVRHREMPEVIAEAHIGAAPFLATERNTKQGFCPIKVLEYMACGLPVVAPAIPSVEELARHDIEGILYKPNSLARLSDALTRLIDDEMLRLRLGENGRTRTESFTWKNARLSLTKVYRGLLERSGQ